MKPLDIYLFAILVFLIAGGIKGLVGMGLPTISISLLSLMIDPKLAITLSLGPLLLTNFWQSWRMGEVLKTIQSFAPLWLSLVGAIYLSSLFAVGMSTQALMAILGSAMVLFALISLMFTPPHLPSRWDIPAQIITGLVAGAMGGITAIWGPPVLIFLIARDTGRDAFVRATGVLLTLGALPLLYNYWAGGLFTGADAFMSFALTLPAIVGFAIGERFRTRLDARRFRKLLLWMFVLLGANLLRRAFF